MIIIYVYHFLNQLIEVFQYKKEKENNEKDFLDTLV